MQVRSLQLWLRKRWLTFLLGLLTFTYIFKNGDIPQHTVHHKHPEDIVDTMTFKDSEAKQYFLTLRDVADNKKVVVLALVDAGFVDMAVNFWETSITPHGITNMLFVSLSKDACILLSKQSIPCHVYSDLDGGQTDSTYMSPLFLKKMNIRTQFILDALNWNFTVLNTDTDVLFLKNPLNHFTCSECHLELLEDGIKGLLNAGFVYLRPTNWTSEVYKRMAAVAKKNPRSEDQATLNTVIKKTLKGKVHYKLLDQSKFMCGKTFYENGKRYFGDVANPCSECVVVHNNWIVGKAAKIYRQKEMLQWLYDGNQYFSDPNRKYITYSNTLTFKDEKTSILEEKRALINAFAIGMILNRTVILPKVHYRNSLYPWNTLFYISHLDDSFGNKYRESVFLNHPKVPSSVKESLSPVYHIKTENKQYSNLVTPGNVILKVPGNGTSGASSDEILSWFAKEKEAVLQFHSLYGAFLQFADEKDDVIFAKLIKDAFKRATYRQY